MRTLLSALLLLGALPSLARADEPAKVVVVPFAPLGGDVPNNAGNKSADVLVTSLKAFEHLAPSQAGGGAADDPQSHVKRGNEALAAGRKKLEAGQPHGARVDLQSAVKELGMGSAALEDPETLADAWSALSRAAFQSGDDAAGEIALRAAEGLHPGKEFAEVKSSALFAGKAAKAKEAVAAAGKATLRIGSVPPGATARIDGMEAGRTPVDVKEIVPGPHLWRVDLPGGGSVGGVVEIESGKKAEVLGAAVGTGPAAPLGTLLAGNQLPATATKELKEAAAGLEAAFLVLGGLHTDGTDLLWDGFVYSAKTGALARLPRARFDADLVSAGQALDAVAADVAGRIKGGALGAEAKLPTKVAEGVSAERAELSEFRFPAPGVEVAPKKETGPRKVVGGKK